MSLDRRSVLKGAGAAALLPLVMAGSSEAARADVDDATVYELRTYHLNEGKLPLILERFRTKETELFARHGMHGVAYWTPTDEPLAGRTLIYLLRHQSREAATASWKAFSSDPEWVALKAETEKNGTFVTLHESTFMKLTDFSPKV
jgi:hypothetical protein